MYVGPVVCIQIKEECIQYRYAICIYTSFVNMIIKIEFLFVITIEALLQDVKTFPVRLENAESYYYFSSMTQGELQQRSTNYISCVKNL